ncbi:APC family permease [Catenulispora pinistramenti]|uniref:APC family permease n=1 Tax=Catenulispora pinistramenti TaxID=2705254 RepID=UPI001E3BC84A|nr:APC family permease [Catenulispora pinistramenti]
MSEILTGATTSTSIGEPGTQLERADPAPAKPELARSLGLVGAVLLTLSCLTPASSLFVIVPGLFATQGTGTALTLAIAGVLCVGVAFCYSELGTLIPSAGGEYAMVGSLLGRVAGWLTFFLAGVAAFIIPPIIAIGTGEYLHAAIPALPVNGAYTGAFVMAVSTVMGVFDLRANAWITGVFLVLEVVAAGLVAVLGFAHSHQGASVLIHPVVADGPNTTPLRFGTLMVGLAVALFALQGFATAVYLSEEIQKPRRNVSRAVLWTLALGAVVVIVPTVAVTLGASGAGALTGANFDLIGLVKTWSNAPVGAFVALCVAAAIVNAAIVMVIQNSRILFASARDKAWPEPVNRALGTVSARFGAPWVATLAVGAPGAALCFAPVDTLNGVTGVAVTGLYLVVAVAASAGRRGAYKARSAWRMPWWPLVPVLVVASLVGVLFELWRSQPSDLYWTLGATAAAALYWLLYLRPRAATRWLIDAEPGGEPG